MILIMNAVGWVGAQPATQSSVAASVIRPRADGVIELSGKDAKIHGTVARFMVLEGIGNICYWTNAKDWLSWECEPAQAGEYAIELKYSVAADSKGSAIEVKVADQTIKQKFAKDTGSWYDHETAKIGAVTLAQPGKLTVSVTPSTKPGTAVMNLVWLRLIPAEKYEAYKAQEKATSSSASFQDMKGTVYVVPNFHPASCGWLTNFSTERNYCAYSYLDHLDRVRDDPNYAFALSEINNIMAIMEFEPERVAELKQRIQERRVELVNAFFLEPTINLSGGEALVKQGVEGLRWQTKVMGARPRILWAIDVCGTHEQMAQITAGLGLDALVFTRGNPTGSSIFWAESPDGTRALTLSPGHYSDWGNVFKSPTPLDGAAMKKLTQDVRRRMAWTPLNDAERDKFSFSNGSGGAAARALEGTPVVILGGSGDYAVAPVCKSYPSELIRQWKQTVPNMEMKFTGLSAILDAIAPAIKSNPAALPVMKGGTRFFFDAFWIQSPRVKTWYRRAEQELQAAEMAATIANLTKGAEYPVQSLYHAWLLMLLNMDRNTLWGAAGGMVFEHPWSWDARDRFETVETIATGTLAQAMRAAQGKGEGIGFFNSLNWQRNDPIMITLPSGASIAGAVSEAPAEQGAQTLCRISLPPMGMAAMDLSRKAPAPPRKTALPETITTEHYLAKIDPATGALTSLKLKKDGREMLGGPANVLVAEKGQGGGDHQKPRAQRPRLFDSSQTKPEIAVTEGPLATTVEIKSRFYKDTPARRVIRFYKDYPRIDFETELEDIPDQTVVVAEFPLAEDVTEIRRGIPYGFSHGAWSKPNPALPGWTKGICPAVRWSDYQMSGGGGLAILDRGLSGREITERMPVIFLLNAVDKYRGYPNSWLSGRPKQRLEYAIVAHGGGFAEANIPRMAWEYSCPPMMIPGVKPAAPVSFAQTSDNIIIEAIRREGADIEIRLAESLGATGTASILLALPHTQATLTDLTGANPKPLPPALGSGPQRYEFPIRPQQIVTMRLRTENPVAEIQPLLKWDELVPECKRNALHVFVRGRKGHPPFGDGVSVPTLPPDACRALTPGKKTTASSIYKNQPNFAPELATDGAETSRWAADEAATQGWLQVDLGAPQKVTRAYLSEGYDRIQEFELQYQSNGEWKTFAQGAKIGQNNTLKFTPIEAQQVRLNVLKSTAGPTIWEFMLFP
ncbi:MAG: discoidin domain-containing protein [Candidatus Sumerlaeota bacterium]|nr:discoidin domain-containing protein [Candidatus Sumerlaeota bacterium]